MKKGKYNFLKMLVHHSLVLLDSSGFLFYSQTQENTTEKLSYLAKKIPTDFIHC
jgi:hypothetical protein